MNSMEVNQSSYLENFAKTLLEFSRADILCDTTVVAKNREFTAHSAVLAAASPMLRSLFVNSVAQKSMFRIELPEADGLVVESILYFMYTGNSNLVPESKLTAEELTNLRLTCEQLGLNWIFNDGQRMNKQLDPTEQQLNESTYDIRKDRLEPDVPELQANSKLLSDDCHNNCLELLNRSIKKDGMNSKFICSFCSDVFESSTALEAHKISHDAQTLTCEYCGCQFDCALAFQRHSKIHKDGFQAVEPKCDVSDAICPVNVELMPFIEMKTDDDATLFCHICGRGFENVMLYEIHMQNLHSTKQLFVCSQCQKPFTDKSQLRKHLLIHESSKNFVCEVCSRSFSQEYYLKKHQRTHSNSHNCICPSCGKQFKLLEYLKAHMKSHCSSNDDVLDAKPQKLHQCSICSQTFSHRSYLKKHAQTHSEQKLFECETCGKRLKVSCLQQHMLTHSTERPYGCDKCGRRFTRQADLQAHLQTHSGTKSHWCPVCVRGFHKKGDLQRHIRIHTGERPYVCETCGKSFKILFHLRLHSYVHSTDRPHQCNTCGKAFSSTLRLKKHEYIHSGVCPYACPICSRKFNRHANMRSHLKTHGHQILKTEDPMTENGVTIVFDTDGTNHEETQTASDNLEIVYCKIEQPEVLVALPLDSLQTF